MKASRSGTIESPATLDEALASLVSDLASQLNGGLWIAGGGAVGLSAADLDLFVLAPHDAFSMPATPRGWTYSVPASYGGQPTDVGRYTPLNGAKGIDVIYSNATTIGELLAGFDLSVHAHAYPATDPTRRVSIPTSTRPGDPIRLLHDPYDLPSPSRSLERYLKLSRRYRSSIDAGIVLELAKAIQVKAVQRRLIGDGTGGAP